MGDIKRMPLRSRRHGDSGHEIIHVLQWAPHLPPMTLCKQYTLRDDPTPEQEARNKDLVVNCIGCLAELD